MLYDGIDTISEDSRVKAIIDLLTMDYDMSYESIALYSSISLSDVENFMKDTSSISFEKKYKLAVAAIFLHFLLKKEPNYDFTNNMK
ncbi:hypothetical protein CFB3_34250 [Clostridium folliculivorans]|uniref:Uncharacterized protein n=1 Tax=Clostridium folliculivorans TaxID=2886038 RepID=A0A9W5Y298_9CLOT|nr:HTH domain-containing protein [Clostridium folliculivorans]GKU25220.1 hypothetical protein CFOLD11_20460 [Clostridium folliculivorans]GKU31318.1 hypothetical protein CFB3_34250 [Clostridium folliculivorans]